VYDLAARKVFISRDVLFFEQCFPSFQQHNGTSSPLTLPIYDDVEDLPTVPVHNPMSQHDSTPTLPHNLPDNFLPQSSDSLQPTAEA